MHLIVSLTLYHLPSLHLPLFSLSHSLPLPFCLCLGSSLLPQHTSFDQVLTCSQLLLICAYINWKYVHLPIKNTSCCSHPFLPAWHIRSVTLRGHTHNVGVSMLQLYIDDLFFYYWSFFIVNWLIINPRLTWWIFISGCRLHQLTCLQKSWCVNGGKLIMHVWQMDIVIYNKGKHNYRRSQLLQLFD